MSSLNVYGYVQELDSRQGYVLGPTLLRWISPAKRTIDIKEAAQPHLEFLARRHSDVTKLTMVRDLSAVVVRVVESTADIRLHVSEGSVSPLYCGAANKALLAFAPGDVLQDVLLSPKEAFTSTTLVDNMRLLQTLKVIRACGFAYDDGEYVAGVNALAVPIFAGGTSVIGAFSMAYMTSNDHNEKLKERLDSLVEAAVAVSKEYSSAHPYELDLNPETRVARFEVLTREP